MSRRRKARQRETASRGATAGSKPRADQPGGPPREPLRPWRLAGLTALLVAWPLFPGDSPALLGDGLPLVMLWIALLLSWMLEAIGRPHFHVRFGWTDAAVLLLVAWHTGAGVWAAVHGSPRPAINALWQWIALALAFFLARQFVAGGREARTVAAVMIAVAVGLSGYGLYQHFYELPRDREAYEADPEGMLRAAGQWYAKDSPERQLFERRLETSGPIATFTLSNSLAAYLAPWLIVLFGIVIAGGLSRKRLAMVACCAIPMVACLLLTKSRSACLAAGCGVVLLVWMFCRQRGMRLGWRLPLGAAATAAILVAAAVATGRLNRQVISRAATSFGYRLQYWQSTWAMIADHPWLGCGPGNFQNVYTRYKLPEASEEVADPHDFLLEVWATAGTPAALALLAVLGCFGWAAWRNAHLYLAPRCGRSPPRCGRSPDRATTTTEGLPRAPETCRSALSAGSGDPRRTEAEGGRGTAEGGGGGSSLPPQPAAKTEVFVLAGAACGFPLAWVLGLLSAGPPDAMTMLIEFSLAAGSVVLMSGWIRAGRLPSALPAIGVVVLLVDLLTTGGISFPGVAGTFWLLLAIGLCAPEEEAAQGSGAVRKASPLPPGDGPHALPRIAALAGLVLAITLAVTCYSTAYSPVLRCQGLMHAAQREILEDRPAQAEKYLEAAAAADPLAAEPRRQLAQITFYAWSQHPTQQAFEEFEVYNDAAVQRARNSAMAWLESGDWYQKAYAKRDRHDETTRMRAIEKAMAAHEQAVNLYPNSALCRAKLALAYKAAGYPEAFREQAKTALELDDQTPHLDKKLGALREQLR